MMSGSWFALCRVRQCSFSLAPFAANHENHTDVPGARAAPEPARSDKGCRQKEARAVSGSCEGNWEFLNRIREREWTSSLRRNDAPASNLNSPGRPLSLRLTLNPISGHRALSKGVQSRSILSASAGSSNLTELILLDIG